jgi:hypothetical protein
MKFLLALSFHPWSVSSPNGTNGQKILHLNFGWWGHQPRGKNIRMKITIIKE